MEEKGNIILYTTPDGVSKIEVTLQNETVWLTLDQMAQLFQGISRKSLKMVSWIQVQLLRFLQQFKRKATEKLKGTLFFTTST